MSSDWKETTLGEVVLKANTGADAIQKAPIVNYDSGIRCLRIQDVSNKHKFNNWGFCNITQDNYKRFCLKLGDILIARTGNTIGVNMYIDSHKTAVFNNGLIRLKINTEKYIPKYIYYSFQTYYFKKFIDSIAYGTSTQPNMQINSLLTFKIPDISIDYQQQIVEILSCLDAKIDNLRRQNETLEKIAQLLFKRWFIDFEFPNEEENPYKSSGGEMQPSELGDIPKGWTVGKLGDVVAKANTGADAIQKAPIVDKDTGIRCLRVGDLTNKRPFSEWGFCEVTEKNYNQYRLQKNDLLVTRTSALGLNILILKDLKSVFNNGLIKLILKKDCNPAFVYSFLQSKNYTDYINRITYETSTRPNMKIDYLLDFPFLLSNKNTEKAFSDLVLTIYLKIDSNTKQKHTRT